MLTIAKEAGLFLCIIESSLQGLFVIKVLSVSVCILDSKMPCFSSNAENSSAIPVVCHLFSHFITDILQMFHFNFQVLYSFLIMPQL